jgi:site-specific recombinase XerD
MEDFCFKSDLSPSLPMQSPFNQAVSDDFSESADWLARGTVLRRLGRHHFAFFKGHLEGLDLRRLAERYLEAADQPGDDLREAKTTLRWIAGELAMLAKRHGRFADARILALPRERIADADPAATIPSALPSLDDFREEHDPDGFYTENELVNLFAHTYPPVQPDRKLLRNARLREKQARALVALEAKVVVDPALDDGVDGWLAPALSSRLLAVGINTLRDLLLIINGRGQRWYVSIPQIGEKAAARVLRWLQLTENVLGVAIGPHVQVKRRQLDLAMVNAQRQREQAIVPLEWFQPRAGLDGSQGANRGVRNRSGVDNDYDAIHLWLSTLPAEGHTWRSYRKEAERFLLWAILERGKPISSLLTPDCIAYRDFLSDLGRLTDANWAQLYTIPQEKWMGKRGTPRWSALWRPFEQLPPLQPPADLPTGEHAQWMAQQKIKGTHLVGVLSDASQKLAQTILTALCEWLMRQRYLDSNPWDGVPARQKQPIRIQADRSFTASQWTFLMQYLAQMAPDARVARLRFVLLFAYGTGLRLSELTSAMIGDLTYRPTNGARSAAWTLNVLGKGGRERIVVIPSLVMKELQAYLAHRGYPTLNAAPLDAPLIDRLIGVPCPARLRGKPVAEITAPGKLSDQALYKMLKGFFEQVALAMRAESVTEAKHIAQASTHWLRHTCGSHAVANGVPIEVLQANFGHISVDTTSIYITAEIDRRITEMERFMQMAAGETGHD